MNRNIDMLTHLQNELIKHFWKIADGTALLQKRWMAKVRKFG